MWLVHMPRMVGQHEPPTNQLADYVYLSNLQEGNIFEDAFLKLEIVFSSTFPSRRGVFTQVL